MSRDLYIRNISLEDDLRFTPRTQKLFEAYAFFMAFPAIIIIQNISLYFFIAILFSLSSSGFFSFKISTWIQRLSILFGIGALFSTIGAIGYGGSEYFYRSLSVLPNYLYWSILIVLLISYSNYINLEGIFRAITYGLFISIFYFFIFQKIVSVKEFYIFKVLSQNTFAFILICYTPISVFYLKKKLSPLITLLLVGFISFVGFISNSRSGSILVITGAVLSFLVSEELSKKRLIAITIFVFFIIGLTTTPIAKTFIQKLNPRTYSLIYTPENTFATDRSYLLRRAMVEKGINLFTDRPLLGVGLNNFVDTYVDIEGNFKGSKFIIHKRIREGKSAHNSYINILSEGGLVVAIPFLMILLIILKHFIVNFAKSELHARVVFIGLLMMLIHLYFISAILNVFAWFLIGLAAAMVYRENEVRSS